MSSDEERQPEFEDRQAGTADVPLYQESVGEILARARAAQGLTLDDVAHQLKFGIRQLEALEQSRFESLPGSTFARGMVRSYARLLKLDSEALLESVEGKFEVPHADQLATRYREPVPFSVSSRRSTIAYAALSVLILLVAAGVLFGWQQERSGTTRLSFVPAAQAPLELPKSPAKAGSAVAPAKPSPAPAPAEPLPESAKPTPSVASRESSPPATTPTAVSDSAADAAASAAPLASVSAASVPPPAVAAGTDRIVLAFDAESWVEIRDATGRILMSQLNGADTEKAVQGNAPFSIVIGNAQHVRVTYNGEPFDLTPRIRGEVARFTLK